MSESIRRVIQESIIGSIRQQELGVGDQIPTETALAERFSTSRSNAHLAVKALEREGFVKRFRRRGTFIARTVPHSEPKDKPARRVRQRRKLHVLVAADPACMSMHWGDNALHQLERVVHEQGLQLVQETLPDPSQISNLDDLARRLSREGSEALVILAELLGAGGDESYSDRICQCIDALADYPGRICLLNRSGLGLVGWPHDAVSLDPLGEGMRVGRYLCEHQVSRVICVAYRARIWGRLRAQGIEMSLKHNQQAPFPTEIRWYEDERTIGDLFAGVLDDIERRRDRPTVILPKDDLAAKFIDLAKERGMACPEAFCVISFNNDMRFREYNMTTVAPLVESIGDVVGQLICDRIKRPASSSINITLKSTIIERTTFVCGDESSH